MQEASATGTQEAIVDLDHDHDDLIVLLKDLNTLVEQAAVDATRERALREARHLLRYFTEDMARHFRVEEELLFPVLRDELPAREGTVDSLARAHERFEQLVGQVQTSLHDDAISREALDESQGVVQRLIESFRKHSQVECELVRAMDAAVRDPEKRAQLREQLADI